MLEKVYFKADGKGLTHHIRDRFASGDIVGGIDVFKCLTPTHPTMVPNYDSLLKDIILGKRGFMGVTPDIYLDENADNEDITGLVLRAAFGEKEDKEALLVISKILEIDDPIEHLVGSSIETLSADEFCSGWITKKGYFIPAGFSKHNNVCHDIDEKFGLDLHNPVHFFEKRWIRVSYAYQGDYQVIQCFGGEMTEEQKTSLLKYVETHPDEHEKMGYVFINGYGFIKDGKLYKEEKRGD